MYRPRSPISASSIVFRQIKSSCSTFSLVKKQNLRSKSSENGLVVGGGGVWLRECLLFNEGVYRSSSTVLGGLTGS